MAIYDLRCAHGHTHEVIQSFTAPLPPCPECGGATRKVPGRVSIGPGSGAVTGSGSVTGPGSVPPPPEAMPQTWRGTYEGDRDYVTTLRRTADRRRQLEERHPELAAGRDTRPVLAHEGRYEQDPLRG